MQMDPLVRDDLDSETYHRIGNTDIKCRYCHCAMSISIDGPIAAGKSTFLRMLRESTGVDHYREPLNETVMDLLANLYDNPGYHSAVNIQMRVCSGFFESYNAGSRQGSVQERSILSCQLFGGAMYRSGITDKGATRFISRHSWTMNDKAPGETATLIILPSKDQCYANLERRISECDSEIDRRITREYFDQVHGMYSDLVSQRSKTMEEIGGRWEEQIKVVRPKDEKGLTASDVYKHYCGFIDDMACKDCRSKSQESREETRKLKQNQQWSEIMKGFVGYTQPSE